MSNEPQQAKRRYRSPLREAAAAGTRARVLDAAVALLRDIDGVAAFTLEAVAKAAGVSRLTVYNQFGSRLALIEAVFDRIAGLGGLAGLQDAMADPDPDRALGEVVRIFCDFWDGHPSVQRLTDTAVLDPEIERSVAARPERRRWLLGTIVQRAAPAASAGEKRDTVDLLFLLTAPQSFRALAPGREKKDVCDLLSGAALDALHRLTRAS
jgi:AcrR family transcriptional regulator